MSNRFLVILAAIVIIFGGLLVLNKRDDATNNAVDENGQTIQPTEHKIEGSSGVVLTEYGDFQCPGCGAYHPVLKELKAQYKDKVTFQFRHNPLVQIHQNALIASRAAEAAAKQDKFWEMHDMLFENQNAWSSSPSPSTIFETYAKELGLDVNAFREAIKSEEVNKIVQADVAEARRKNYMSTPIFEINGQKIETPQNIEEFTKLIDEAIKEKEGNQ